ncbi:MAG: hypothetical protein ACI4KF_02220 [Huintestinicola sp.]
MNEENAVMNGTGECTSEAADEISAEDRITELEKENEKLRRELVLRDMGIGGEGSEALCAAAEKIMEKEGCGFAEAAETALARITGLRRSDTVRRRSTGVRISDASDDGDAALRRAFGLR